uniref:CSON006078 protein n=1 Tax=Culicoides sonorensis TaxID=179676 RepID=A0A336MSW2_CULSO
MNVCRTVKKRQQRVQMILESKHIDFTVIDITEPTQDKEKDFMQANSTEMGVTVSDQNPRHPLPPQIFNGEQYCGDYNGFELANENDELEQFLKIEVKNGVSAPVAPVATITTEEAPVNGKLDDEKTEETVENAEPIAEVNTEPEVTEETTNNEEVVAPDEEKVDSEKTTEE